MAQTGKLDLVSGASAYEHSFGMLKSGTVYSNPLNKLDKRSELKSLFDRGKEVIMKALNSQTGGAGTAGYALVPIYVDSRIVDQSRKFTPLVEVLPRVTNQGLTADYNVITAKGSAYTAAEDGSLAEANDTYDRQSKSIKFLYSVGRVTGPAVAAIPSYMMAGFQPTGSGLGQGGFSDSSAPNGIQMEVLVKARALKELEENLLLNGDSSSDSTQFDGLITIQGTTNVVDKAGAALAWDDIEDSIQLAFNDGGRPKIGVGSSGAVKAVRSLMIDTFRHLAPETTELFAGVAPFITIQTMVGPIPIIPSMFINSAQTSGQDALYFFDTDVIEVRVLQDMTYEELAKTNDSKKFMLKQYECVINRAPQFSCFVDNIAA